MNWNSGKEFCSSLDSKALGQTTMTSLDGFQKLHSARGGGNVLRIRCIWRLIKHHATMQDEHGGEYLSSWYSNRPRHKKGQFKANLGYIVRPYVTKTN